MRTAHFFVAALFSVLFLENHAVLSQNRQRIAILPLSVGPQLANDLSVSASAAIENALVELFTSKKKFDVVERAQLEKIIYEHQLSQSGMINDSTALQIGRMLSAELLLFGSLTQAEIGTNNVEGKTYYLGKVGATIKVVASESGSVLGAITESASSNSGISDFGASTPTNDLVVKASRNLVNTFFVS